jgi:transcriptional regulator with XRE-family HTH domain
MLKRHQMLLYVVERLIAAGWRRSEIAQRTGYTRARISQIARELKNAGKIVDARPDQAAAQREFLKVLVLCAAEERRKL